tara:strand:- start:252 stop:848 length:597 start_codon:yes stop_codon:yes gene_type:complete
MSELMFIKTSEGLVPHTDTEREVFKKWKLGEVIAIKTAKRARNPKFHRKFFNLLNLAFDYYEPSSGVLTKDEKLILKKVFVELDNQANNSGVLLDWGREFIKAETNQRKSEIINIENAFEPFRKDMIIAAGYYDEHRVPSGTVKVARSISFASMGEDDFNALYKAVFNVCWRFVLSRNFKNETEAQNAVDQLLSYSGG